MRQALSSTRPLGAVVSRLLVAHMAAVIVVLASFALFLRPDHSLPQAALAVICIAFAVAVTCGPLVTVIAATDLVRGGTGIDRRTFGLLASAAYGLVVTLFLVVALFVMPE